MRVRVWEVVLESSRKGAESGRVLQRRSVLPGSPGSAPGARATRMSDEQKSGTPRPQVEGLPRVVVGPRSPQEEGKEGIFLTVLN